MSGKCCDIDKNMNCKSVNDKQSCKYYGTICEWTTTTKCPAPKNIKRYCNTFSGEHDCTLENTEEFCKYNKKKNKCIPNNNKQPNNSPTGSPTGSPKQNNECSKLSKKNCNNNCKYCEIINRCTTKQYYDNHCTYAINGSSPTVVTTTPQKTQQSNNSIYIILLIVGIILLFILIGVSILYFYQKKKVS
jgi:hypothetical protein